MSKKPLLTQLMAWELIKWNAEQEIKAVQTKINRRIKQLKRDNDESSKNSNTDG